MCVRTFVTICWFAVLFTATGLGPALAVTVPGDYPTIQAALDAGATEIQVADGTYHETILVTHSVNLLPLQPAFWSDPVPVPRVDGMQIQGTSGMSLVYVRGLHFTGPVTLDGKLKSFTTSLEACRLDGGFRTLNNVSMGLHVNIRHCLVLGDLYAFAYYPDIADNVVVGGGITAHANGGGTVTGNLIIGPAKAGITLPSPDVGSEARGNTIRNVQDGIVAAKGDVDSNLVEDCSGTAYKGMTTGGLCTARFVGNVARRCAGHGVEAPSTYAGLIQGNTVDSLGLNGIHVAAAWSVATVSDNVVSHSSGHGIWTEAGGSVTGNSVLGAGGDGIRAEHADAVTTNVVGRCAGAGIVAPDARHNTSHQNGGAGFELAGTGTESITHNIAYGNAGAGLLWSGTGTPVLGCNDWFDNDGGMVTGTDPGATDLSVNPLFCDLAEDDVSLSADSPLLDPEGCGLIGALGQGCIEAVGVPPDVAVPVLAFTVSPNPSGAAVRFSWPGSVVSGRVDVYDITGARRWGEATVGGRTFLVWNGDDQEGRRLPAGVYYARFTCGGESSRAKFVLVQ